MCTIELLDSGIEFYALLAFNEELCNFGAPLHILRFYFPDFSFLCPPLGLCMRRAEGVLGPLLPMLL